jgi:hypothetical protein
MSGALATDWRITDCGAPAVVHDVIEAAYALGVGIAVAVGVGVGVAVATGVGVGVDCGSGLPPPPPPPQAVRAKAKTPSEIKPRLRRCTRVLQKKVADLVIGHRATFPVV